ncbi:MAG: ABC transporter substrate-binding protein, partial [Acidimicrobiales bacterium]
MTLLLVGVFVAACGSSTNSSTAASKSNSSSPGSPKRGGSLTIALEANWAAIDPLKGTALDDGSVFSAVYDSLFSLNSKGTAEPDLATSYAVSNGGLTYTIQLRHGVEFQDGTPFNAAAAVVNLDRVLNPANACACRSSLAPIQSVAADGSYAITVQLKEPYAPLPTVLASFPGMMASPAAIQKYGAQLGFHPVGTGPFMFKSMVMNSSVHFVRWDHYWKSGEPYLDSLTFLAGSTSPSEYAAVREGTIQVDNLVATQEYLQAVKNPSVHVVVTPAWGTTFIMMATNHPPFNNRLARLAVSYATDQAALQKAFGIPGLSLPTESPLPPASWAYPGKNVPGYAGYDLAKAKALVKQLGGLTFSLSVAQTADMSLYDALQAEWKAAGMNVSIVSYDQVTL